MNSYNILVVEDDKEIAKAIEIYIKNQGYKVFVGNNGQEGLEIIKKENIHLAIVDIMMPVMDGIQMTIKLREKFDFPVIMLSAKSEEIDKIMGLNIGADDYVTKPFAPLELIARVNSQIRRYKKYLSLLDNDKKDEYIEEDEVYTIGGLELNIDKIELTYTDDVIYYKSMSIDSYKIGVIMVKYIAISFLIMMILGLVISYKSVDEDFILGRILNWPFEILSFLMICGAISLLINPEFVRYSLNNTEIVEAFSKYDISENFIKYGINILNIVYWMLIFIAIFGAMQLIKYIFGKGIINYIKENTLTGRLVIHLINKAKEIFENISRIDLKEEGNKYIFKVVLINFVIVSIFCAFWFTGILGTIIYSVILFYVLRKYMNELRCKYEIPT